MIILQSDNFAKWSFQFQSVLEGYDLFDYFDGTNICPPKYVISLESGVTKEVTAAYREWIKGDKALLSLLIATLGDEAIEYVVGSKTAHEAWTQLTDRYATVSRARINHLKTELHTIKKGAYSIEKYLLRLKHLKDQLRVAGETISDNDLIVAALAGLSSEYNMIKTVIVARESIITLKEFRAQLLSAERTAEEYNSSLQFPMTGMLSQGESSAMGASRQYYQGVSSIGNGLNGGQFYQGESSATGASRQSYQGDHSYGGVGFVGHFPRSNGTGPNGGIFSQSGGNFSQGNNKGGSTWGNWNGNTGQRSHIIPECQICNKRGHTTPNCYYMNEQLPTSNQAIPECQICGKRGHTALNCFHRGNYAFQGTQPPSSLNAMTAQSSLEFDNNQAWIMDTGATHHMTGNVGDLNMVTSFEGDQTITVGSDECLPVKNTGSSSIKTSSKPLNLYVVLHVPKLAASLISVYTLCKDNNCYVILDEFGFWVQDKATKTILMRGRSSGGLYHIPKQLFFKYNQLIKSTPKAKAFLGQLVKTSLWHHRLGHPTNEVLHNMLSNSKITYKSD